jgi:hypothetical protein
MFEAEQQDSAERVGDQQAGSGSLAHGFLGNILKYLRLIMPSSDMTVSPLDGDIPRLRKPAFVAMWAESIISFSRAPFQEDAKR